MKTDIQKNGEWWSHIEICDKCGKLVRTHGIQSSCEPDIEEADFCAECLRYLLDNGISYGDAKKLYKN